MGTVQFVPDGLGEGGLKIDNSLAQGWQNAKGPQQTQADGKTTVKIEQTADKVQNKVGDVDVDVDVSRNGDADANAQ